ncbi:hypothetical protein D3C71_1786610 [compost metagenome]
MPSVSAPWMPCSFSNTPAQAPAVPWPPSSVIEPAIRPISGSRPSSVARPTPTTFCTTMKMLMMNRNSSKAEPPSRSLEKFALRPIEEKNSSMKPVCRSLLKTNA